MSLPVEGLLNVDKPTGLTSHDVVNHIRRLSGVRRVGHAGTLDPLATGVLLVCIGRTTRLVEYLVDQPKTYEATVRLGQVTDTYDADGRLVAEYPIPPLSPADLEQVLAQFRGPIRQAAPLYSAIKKAGQPLYKLARQGAAIERPLRDVTIYRLELLAWQPPYLYLRVTCSAGTYIRSLAHDIGEQLACGGHIIALRRMAIGNFTVGSAVPLTELTPENLPAFLQASDTAIYHFPRLDLSVHEAQRLQKGQPVARQPHQPDGPLVRLYDPDGHFIGVAVARDSIWRAQKIFQPVSD